MAAPLSCHHDCRRDQEAPQPRTAPLRRWLVYSYLALRRNDPARHAPRALSWGPPCWNLHLLPARTEHILGNASPRIRRNLPLLLWRSRRNAPAFTRRLRTHRHSRQRPQAWPAPATHCSEIRMAGVTPAPRRPSRSLRLHREPRLRLRRLRNWSPRPAPARVPAIFRSHSDADPELSPPLPKEL